VKWDLIVSRVFQLVHRSSPYAAPCRL